MFTRKRDLPVSIGSVVLPANAISPEVLKSPLSHNYVRPVLKYNTKTSNIQHGSTAKGVGAVEHLLTL